AGEILHHAAEKQLAVRGRGRHGALLHDASGERFLPDGDGILETLIVLPCLEGDRYLPRSKSHGVAFRRLDPAADLVRALLGRRLVRTDAQAVTHYFGILARREAEDHAQAHAHAADRPDADVLAVHVLGLVIAGLNPILRGKADGGLAAIVEEHARFHHA